MAGNTIRKAEASSSGTVVALPAKTIRSGHEELRSTDEWRKDPLDAAGEAIDRVAHAAMAHLTAGLSPMALAGAAMDWAAHLASLTRQAVAAGPQGSPQSGPPQYLSQPYDARPRRRMLHRAAAAGPPLRGRGLAEMALQRDLPGLSAEPAMVAQRDHRHRRRDGAARAGGRVRKPSGSVYALPVEFPPHESRRLCAHARDGWRKPRPGFPELVG